MAIKGNGKANTLSGTTGADRIYGFGGNDTIYGKGGNDRIEAGAGNDLVRGGDGNDTITGNRGNDRIYGDKGDDVINGGEGNDLLFGGAGHDVFVFKTALNARTNVDRIADFKHGADHLQIDNAVFRGLALGNLDADAFHVGTAAADKEDRIIYDRRHGDLYFDVDGAGGHAAVKFAHLDNHALLTAADFLII